MTTEMRGKTVLVTGGGRGLDRAIARKFGSAGAMVAINYATNSAAADATVREIEASGGQAFAIQAQLGSAAAARKLAGSLSEELSRRTGSSELDVLVNNIGGGGYSSIEHVDEASYDYLMNLNLKGGFFLTQALLPSIRAEGRIINISSAGARLSDPMIIVYTMAKAALDAFTRVLAQSVGARGITVNSVSPGFMDGETNADLLANPDAAKQVQDLTALGRVGTEDEAADIVYALASPMGRLVTAQVVEVSGGFKL